MSAASIEAKGADVNSVPKPLERESGRTTSKSQLSGSLDAFPDLRGRIAELGLMREYAAYRANYLNWRKGHARGAKGEITAEALQSRAEEGTSWLGSYSKWQWRRTISYWVAITFFEGSLIFTITSFSANAGDRLGANLHPMTSWSVTAGGLCYIISTYLMCLETVNLDRTHSTWSPFPSPSDRERWTTLGITIWPYGASVTYFVGALVYFVPIVSTLFIEAHEWLRSLETILVVIPYIVAGFLFALGGLCECIDNRTFTSLLCTSGWWGALINLIGGILFFAAGVAMPFSGWWSNTLFGVGSGTYALGGAVMIVMWKDQQFGLTFLAALNNLEKSKLGGSEVHDKATHFSLRSLLCLLIYVISASLSVCNFDLRLNEMMEKPTFITLTRLYNEALPFFILHMALVLMSAVIRMPKATPYHQLMIALRLLLLTVAANTFCTVIAGLA